MLTDKGFSRAIAEAVLEDDPTNKAAIKVLGQPKNRCVIGGATYDLDKVSEQEVKKTWAGKVVSHLVVVSGTDPSPPEFAVITDTPKSEFGVAVSYAYCDHCGAEYTDWKLDYARNTASGRWLRCERCNKEISNFTPAPAEDE